MGYVYYTSHLAISKRHQRTHLGKLTTWLGKRAAGTYIQSSLTFLFEGSWVARYATGITVGLFLGALIDLSFHVLPGWHLPMFAWAVLGAVVGWAADGAGGAWIGSLWGWLVGGVTSAITSKALSSSTSRLPSKMLSWIVTCLLSWWISLLARRCFDKVSEKSKRWHRVITSAALVIVFTSIPIFFYRVILWELASHHLVDFWQRHWRGGFALALWIVTIPFATLTVLTWWEQRLEREEQARKRKEQETKEAYERHTEQQLRRVYPLLSDNLRRRLIPLGYDDPFEHRSSPYVYSPYERLLRGSSSGYFPNYILPPPISLDCGGRLRPLERVSSHLGLGLYMYLPGFYEGHYRLIRFGLPVWLMIVATATYLLIPTDFLVPQFRWLVANWPPLVMAANESSPFWAKALISLWRRLR